MLVNILGFSVFMLLPLRSSASIAEGDLLPDLIVEYRIAELDNLTPVPLDFNEEVKYFIDLFLTERLDALERVIGLGELYFPLIEEVFDRHKLPLEIKYIAVVESALNPFAVSSSGAVGMWQFLLHTARMFDLQVDSYIDERRDVYKSTEAAARYMVYLYDIFGDWHLVFAAYNSGPGVVRNAIERSGGSRNYWKLRTFLPEQSQRFVPAFIALNYLMIYYEDYNIEPVEPEFRFNCLDTLQVTRPLNLAQVSGELDIPIGTLRSLNPVYRRDFIPSNGKRNNLVLPSEYVIPFLNNIERIYSYQISRESMVNTGITENVGELVKITHRVRKGEFIHKIALMYGTVAENVIRWNELNDSVIYEGQELILWISPLSRRSFDGNTHGNSVSH